MNLDDLLPEVERIIAQQPTRLERLTIALLPIISDMGPGKAENSGDNYARTVGRMARALDAELEGERPPGTTWEIGALLDVLEMLHTETYGSAHHPHTERDCPVCYARGRSLAMLQKYGRLNP